MENTPLVMKRFPPDLSEAQLMSNDVYFQGKSKDSLAISALGGETD